MHFGLYPEKNSRKGQRREEAECHRGDTITKTATLKSRHNNWAKKKRCCPVSTAVDCVAQMLMRQKDVKDKGESGRESAAWGVQEKRRKKRETAKKRDWKLTFQRLARPFAMISWQISKVVLDLLSLIIRGTSSHYLLTPPTLSACPSADNCISPPGSVITVPCTRQKGILQSGSGSDAKGHTWEKYFLVWVYSSICSKCSSFFYIFSQKKYRYHNIKIVKSDKNYRKQVIKF